MLSSNFVSKLLVVIFICSHFFAFSQIVNIESLRQKTDTNGIFGDVDGMLNLSQKQKKYLTWTLNTNIAYKYNKHYIMFVNRFNWMQTRNNGINENFANDGFHHLRYNYKFTELIRGELFLQSQYNQAMKLSRRNLGGAGLRFKLYGGEKFRFYAGTAAMYEYEKLNDIVDVINRRIRISNYISTTLRFDPFSLINTTYYQPTVDNFAKYRISSATQLSVKVYKNIGLKLGLDMLWDSDLPSDVPFFTYTLKSTIAYKF